MSMKDFPPTPFPEGVECHQKNGVSIEVIGSTIAEGECELCRDSMASVIFDVGAIHHHLCRECFEKMMRAFAPKSNSVLLKNGERTGNVSRDFEMRQCKFRATEPWRKGFCLHQSDTKQVPNKGFTSPAFFCTPEYADCCQKREELVSTELNK